MEANKLIVGRRYQIDSGLGGVFTIEYLGKKDSLYQFENIHKDFGKAVYTFTSPQIRNSVKEILKERTNYGKEYTTKAHG